MAQAILSFSFVVACLNFGSLVAGQDTNAAFNQVINLNGNMDINRIVFPDNSKIETFSQKQQQLIVNQNPSPLTANHVVGSTGQPFVQLSQNSMTIATNNASDLVGAQIELPIDASILSQNNITPDNTFVAMLSPGRQAWVVMEGIKSVNTTDNTVRIVKMTSIDGEYMAIGRQSIETSNVLTPFGGQSVNVSGSGIQEIEYQDGFRMSMKASQPMTIQTKVVNGVSTSMITDPNTVSINNYRYLVTSNLASVAPNLNSMVSVVQLPLNMQRVMTMAQTMGVGPNDAITLGISQRTVLQNPGGASGNLSPTRKRLARRAARPQDPTTDTAASNDTATAPAADTSATDPTTPDTTTPDSATSTSAADASATSNSADQQSSQADTPSNTNNNNPAATQLLLSPTFTPVSAPTVLDRVTGRVMVPVGSIDGELIVTMQRSTGQTAQGGNGTSTLGASSNQGGTTVTMAELTSMMQGQQMGGAFAAMDLMQQFMQSNGIAGQL